MVGLYFKGKINSLEKEHISHKEKRVAQEDKYKFYKTQHLRNFELIAENEKKYN